ncbi:hypothetical protein PN473_07490, partial [Dolichospermum circinale CS-545/17]|nr:hypothetical protein [Dolichospermum circinale CS-545/17]
MIKTSLKRGLMAMVAITVPIVGSSVKANAQAVNSLARTTEILTVDTNQLDKHNPGKIDTNEGRDNPPVVVPKIIGKQSHQDTAVIVPNPTITPITAQVPQPKPTPPSGTESNQENQNLPTTPPTSSPNPETTEARVLVSEVIVKTETGKITP